MLVCQRLVAINFSCSPCDDSARQVSEPAGHGHIYNMHTSPDFQRSQTGTGQALQHDVQKTTKEIAPPGAHYLSRRGCEVRQYGRKLLVGDHGNGRRS